MPQSRPGTILLVRSVGEQAYGVLSDRYRRLSSPIIADNFARACQAVGAVPFRANHNDLSWSVEAMLPRALVVNLPNHGQEHIAASVRISNSDFGLGALNMAFIFLRVWCRNGAVGENVMRQVHLGGRLPDDLQLSQETYLSDSRTQALAVRDIVTGLLTEDNVRNRLEVVQAAAAEPVDAQREVQAMVRAKRITKTEAESVSDALMNRNGESVPTGPITRYSLSQALSWVAGNGTEKVDRRDELEREAGRLLGWADGTPNGNGNA